MYHVLLLIGFGPTDIVNWQIDMKRKLKTMDFYSCDVSEYSK